MKASELKSLTIEDKTILANSDKATNSILKKLAKDNSSVVRASLLNCRRITLDILQILATDLDPFIRVHAIIKLKAKVKELENQ